MLRHGRFGHVLHRVQLCIMRVSFSLRHYDCGPARNSVRARRLGRPSTGAEVQIAELARAIVRQPAFRSAVILDEGTLYESLKTAGANIRLMPKPTFSMAAIPANGVVHERSKPTSYILTGKKRTCLVHSPPNLRTSGTTSDHSRGAGNGIFVVATQRHAPRSSTPRCPTVTATGGRRF